jgi:hypothetical protein
MSNINNINRDLQNLNNPPSPTQQTQTPGGDATIPVNRANTQQTRDSNPLVRPQDLQRRSSHPSLRAITEAESIYPQGVPRPPRVQELVSAVMVNDHTALSNLRTSLINDNETCTSAAIGPLLNYAISKNKSLHVKAALAQMPGVQPSELLEVAVRGNDLELARFLLRQGAQPDLAAIDGHTSANMRELLYAADKINRLYADDANYPEYANKYTPLDQALRSYDLNEARRELSGIKAYVEQSSNNGQPLTELDLWFRANTAPDIQRAMLALMPEVMKQLSESQPIAIHGGMPYKISQTLLHYKKMNESTDPRVLNELKKYAYYSEKPGAGIGKLLNGIGMFPNNVPITCAALSWFWLKGIATSQTGKPDYDSVKDKASIEHNMPADVASRHNALWACATEVHRMHMKNWGAFASQKLQSMDRPMQNGDVVQQMMLVNTPLHQMAAEFKIKVENGEKKYVIKFYDPNRTDSHKRISANDTITIEATTISSLLESKSLEATYYSDSCRHLMIYVVSENENWEPIENRTLPQYGDTGRCLTSIDSAIDSEALPDILWHGFDGELKKLKDEIKAMDPNDAVRLLSHKMELFRGNTKAKVPGFYLALQNGHTATVKEFMEIVNGLDIPDEEKIRVLHAEVENTTSGPLAAVNLNQFKTVAAYFEGLNQLKLKDEGKREEAILRLVSDNRPSSNLWTIEYALKDNHAATIEAYMQGVKQLNISDEKKKALILGVTPDGTSAFNRLAREGKLTPDTIKTYLRCAGQFGLPDQMQEDLLAARSKFGLSVFEVMEIAGNDAGCKAYIEGVKELDIPAAMKKALLPAKEHADLSQAAM